jgi:hypothetical protein
MRGHQWRWKRHQRCLPRPGRQGGGRRGSVRRGRGRRKEAEGGRGGGGEGEAIEHAGESEEAGEKDLEEVDPSGRHGLNQTLAILPRIVLQITPIVI